jgi:CheY-like chemotaxis protein
VEQSSVSGAVVERPGAPRGVILVVDDDADIRTVVHLDLELRGYQVREASDGAHAVALATSERMDLVLVDI